MTGHPNFRSRSVVPSGRKMALLLLAVVATRVAALDGPANLMMMQTRFHRQATSNPPSAQPASRHA